MTRALKLFTVERRLAIVAPQLIEALGLPRHIMQVEIYVAAPSKAAGRRLLGDTEYISRGSAPPPLGDAMGNDADALASAVLDDGPAVYVYGGLGYGGADRRVLRVATDGSTVRVGVFEGSGHGQVKLVRGQLAGGVS